MSVEWSGSGPDLLLALERDSRDPLGTQLQDQLRDAIRAQRLRSGELLPSSRRLAAELGVSRGLVQECYAQLLAEGFLTAQGGSGTYVAPRTAPATSYPVEALPPRNPQPAIDFRPGWPDPSSFPRRDWLWALREATRTAPDAAFGYGDPRGALELREILGGYLRRVRGAVADPEQIVICAGYAQGLNLVLRALSRQTIRTVAVEDPGSATDRAAAERWGLRAIPVTVDEHGLNPDELQSTDARAVLLTPAHQSPSGVVLSPERRRAIAAWAMAHQAIVIEDDYDSEFRYDRNPVGALQGLAPEHVALIGTVSKSLSPGLRIGWLHCPPSLLEAVVTEKAQDDRGSPALDQLALAQLMRSGRFDRHLRHMRTTYRSRRAALVTALAAHAPNIELRGLTAGIHAVAVLPSAADERAIALAAADRSVGLYPMSDYDIRPSDRPPQLVLGFGGLTEVEIARGIATIADLLQ